jgi:tetratricopeptide repeat protein
VPSWSLLKRHHSSKIVLARRSDGLGQRLNALLNGMRLADLLDVEFRFTWPIEGWATRVDHSVVPAEEFFSTRFLQKHVDHEASGGGFHAPKRAKDLDDLRSQLREAPRGLLAPNRPLGKVVGTKVVPDIERTFAAEFDRIGFHPDIEAAIAEARGVSLPEGSVGLHLRAGDVLFGRLRMRNRTWDKCVPAPIARALIERFRDEGRRVLVFGQDADLVRHLCDNTGSIEAESLRPEMSRPQRAMFDMMLLSRCERIVGARSGFAGYAANITGKSVETYTQLVSPEDGLELTRADLAKNGAHYHPLQRAFAWWAAYYRARRELSYDEAVELVSAALEADPENPRTQLRLAALHFEQGHLDLGHQVLVDAIVRDMESGDERPDSVTVYGLAWPKWDNRELFDSFDRAIDAGLGSPTLFRAMQRARDNDVEGAQEDLARFRAWLAEHGPISATGNLQERIEADLQGQLELARTQPAT